MHKYYLIFQEHQYIKLWYNIHDVEVVLKLAPGRNGGGQEPVYISVIPALTHKQLERTRTLEIGSQIIIERDPEVGNIQLNKMNEDAQLLCTQASVYCWEKSNNSQQVLWPLHAKFGLSVLPQLPILLSFKYLEGRWQSACGGTTGAHGHPTAIITTT